MDFDEERSFERQGTGIKMENSLKDHKDESRRTGWLERTRRTPQAMEDKMNGY